MKHFNLFPTLLMLIFLATSVSAQTGLKKANKEYDLQAYNLAVPKYLKVLAKKPNSTEALVKLGDCYFHQNYFADAEKYFKRATENDDFHNFKSYLLPYGKTLMAQGKYNIASSVFDQYAKVDPFVGNHFVQSCGSAAAIATKQSDFVIKNEYANSKDSDFGPAFFQNNKVVFTSSKNGTESGWDNNLTNKLYISERDKNRYLTTPKTVRSAMTDGKNEGPVSYSKDGKWVAYTKNNFTNGIRQISSTGLNLSIFIAEVLPNGDWENERPFTYNGSSYSSGFPCFADNGNTLYFASDRPDGLGGFDLFVSTRNGSSWTLPQNLGGTVNTPGNEVTPFFNGGELHFASDWHFGLGGLDIFKAAKSGRTFTNVVNLGNGINSSFDDYGFIYDHSNGIGYLTSNRKGGKGKEDIYRITRTGSSAPVASNTTSVTTSATTSTSSQYGEPMRQPTSNSNTYPSTASTSTAPPAPTTTTVPPTYVDMQEEHKLTILVLDRETGLPIPNGKVNLSYCDDFNDYRTDINGKFGTSKLNKLPCEFVIEPAGYNPINIVIQRLGEEPEQFEVKLSKATAGTIVGSTTPAPPAATTTTTTTQMEGSTAAPLPNNDRRSNSYKGSVKNVMDNNAVEGVTITAINENNQQTLETMTDKFGDFWLSLDENSSYIVRISKAGFSNTHKVVKTANVDKAEGIGTMMFQPSGVAVGSTTTSAPEPTTTSAPIPKVNNTSTTVVTTPAPAPPATEKKYSPPPMPEIKKEGRFSIQLAAKKGNSKISTAPYTSLTDIGDLYQTYEKGYTKLRLGFFSSKSAANVAKKSAAKKGFPEAYIVTEKNKPANYSSTTTTQTKRIDTTSKYKVRLASLTKPENFKRSLVERHGTIESFKSGKFTVFMLSGYSSKETARAAVSKAKKAGFKDAQLVIDNNGKLTPVK